MFEDYEGQTTMKTYLLIAGYDYYPGSGTQDWIRCYATEEDAKEVVEKLKNDDDEYGSYDWFRIVDLKEWMYD